MDNKEFDFDSFKAEAMKRLYKGKKMGGTDGVFAPFKHLLESMLEGELEHPPSGEQGLWGIKP